MKTKSQNLSPEAEIGSVFLLMESTKIKTACWQVVMMGFYKEQNGIMHVNDLCYLEKAFQTESN